MKEDSIPQILQTVLQSFTKLSSQSVGLLERFTLNIQQFCEKQLNRSREMKRQVPDLPTWAKMEEKKPNPADEFTPNISTKYKL